MKKLITIILLFLSINSISQIERKYFGITEDKVNHFTVCYFISFAGNCTAYEITKNKTIGLISGFALGMLAGTGKELYDKNHNGIFSKDDLKADLIGSISGTITIRLILWNSVHMKRATMEQRFLAEQNDY